MSDNTAKVALGQARGRLIGALVMLVFLGFLVPPAIQRHAQTGFYTKYASSVGLDYLYIAVLLLVLVTLIWMALSDFLKALRAHRGA